MEISAPLLLDCLVLLMNDNSERHKICVKELIALHEEEVKIIESSDYDLIRFYIKILHNIMDNNINREDPDAFRFILLKFKSDRALANHRSVLDSLQDAFSSRETASADRLQRIVKHITNVILWHRQGKIMKKNYARHNRAAELTDPEQQAVELEHIRQGIDQIVALHTNAEPRNTSEAFDTINFRKKESIRAGVKKFVARNVSGVIKTGLQGLNRMLGKAGGFVGGESICFAALPHMYKSGILVSIAVWLVIYNIRILDEQGRKPMIYLVSLENESYQNMVWIFKQRYQMETGRSPAGMTDDEIENWLWQFFDSHGIELRIERHLPANFGAKEFMQRCAALEAEGFYLVAAIIDYMHLMKKTSVDPTASKGGRDLMVRELYSTMCNYTKNKGITLITAHPINRQAAAATKQTPNAVKRFGMEYLADSMDPEREVDCMIYMHIEKNHSGDPFLTFSITKHRYVDDTPEAHKYFAYRFTPFGIMDDVGDVPMYVSDIYAADFNSSDTEPVSIDVY